MVVIKFIMYISQKIILSIVATCALIHPLFWKLKQVILVSIDARLMAEARRTVPLLSSRAQFKSALGDKYNISRMSGQWIWKIKPDWRLKDCRMGKLEFVWAASGFLFYCCCCCCCLSLLSQCVRDGCGSDGSLFLLRIQGLASNQHELSRAGKLTSMFYLTLEGGPWRKGRDCYFRCCTLWQSFGLLHSKSWESVSGTVVILLFFPS